MSAILMERMLARNNVIEANAQHLVSGFARLIV